MSFNSLAFIYFFVVVYATYRLVSHRWQNLLLLAASLFFYGAWDVRFLALLLVTIAIDYSCARAIAVATTTFRRRLFLVLSLASNLGVLGLFKYYNFFVFELNALANVSLPLLKILLPIGLSFYTFQAMAYVTDVYRRRISAERDIFDFALFIAFFPQLVAGPIERAKDLLPQLKQPRRITPGDTRHGLMLITYGFFKKLVIADNLAPYLRLVSQGVGNYNGVTIYILMLAMIVFIYADFSGYSDIARGLARMLGIELSLNFKQALFAGDPSDFWRRWHITLTRWFRDYVFWPLMALVSFSRPFDRRAYATLCVLLTFTLCGLWHGAGWNYVIFGLYHGALLLIYHFSRGLFRSYAPTSWQKNRLLAVSRHVLFFHLLSFASILFFVRPPGEWQVAVWRLVHPSWGQGMPLLLPTLLLVLTPLLLLDALIERFGERKILGLERLWQLGLAMVLLALILCCGASEVNEFVYFQF